MNILVTNDDGFDNPGVWALVNAVRHLGKVTVVAPAENKSGVGTAISFRQSLKINPAPSRFDDVECFAVSGTPADSVILGIEHVLNHDVDVVLSGINPGFNTSRNMFISGTFGAAIVAAAKGYKACAFSMDHGDNLDDEVIAKVTGAIAAEVMSEETPKAGLYNVNYPMFRYDPILSAEAAKPAVSDFKMYLDPHSDGGFEVFSGLQIVIDSEQLEPGTDVEVLARDRIAISAVEGPTINFIPDDPTMHRMIAAANKVIG